VNDIAKLPSPRLDVRDLQVVLALAAAGSTARAAGQLHLTQPAVSRALLALEGKLNMPLFERTRTGMVPTPAGERLLSGARELLVRLSDLELHTCSPQLPTELRVVCECYTAYHWLPSALVAMRGATPGLDVTIEVAHAEAPIAALQSGAVDVALLTTARLPPGPFAEEPLFSDEVVFVLAKGHPLAQKAALTRRDLRTLPLLASTLTPLAESQWFMRAVFGPKPPRLDIQRLPLTEAIMDMARAGLGIAAMSEWIAAGHCERGDVVARRLASGPLSRPWRIAYRRELAEPARRLRAVLQTAAPHMRHMG
jgi:LysR family transcriptional regulator for metE and metH